MPSFESLVDIQQMKMPQMEQSSSQQQEQLQQQHLQQVVLANECIITIFHLRFEIFSMFDVDILLATVTFSSVSISIF